MWQTPIYEFRSKKGFKNLSYSSIKIDVTHSAPKMPKPGDQLVKIFNKLIEGKKPAITKILDLGAARLRNSKFFVEKGFQVYAAEFEELFKKGSKTEERFLELKTFENFHSLIFPKDIYAFNEDFFDIILLLNVPTVMPIPVERLCLLLLIRKLLKKNGSFIWYSDPMIRIGKNDYAKRYVRKFLDGHLPGAKKKNIETFYVELHENEIETMIESCGLEIDVDYSEELKKHAYTNIVYRSKPKDRIVFSRALQLDDLIKRGTMPKNGYYVSTEFKSTLELLAEELKLTKEGRTDAYRYQDIIGNTLRYIFKGQLTEMKIESPGEGIRVDVKFRRKNKKGFFKDLEKVYKIPSPYIYCECKNYSEDPGNPEYDQLDTRLKPRTGLFGFLVVRKIQDKAKCLEHCRRRNRDYPSQKKVIMVLEDSDILELIEAKIKYPERINKLLHKKMEEILL
jgi:hypothetical protein